MSTITVKDGTTIYYKDGEVSPSISSLRAICAFTNLLEKLGARHLQWSERFLPSLAGSFRSCSGAKIG
jgi:hypothetical protein